MWKVRKIGSKDTMYVVTDNNGKYAHGNSIKDAKESLIYKITNRDTSRYAGISIDVKLSFAELVEMYRSITGACAAGTKSFVDQFNIEKKEYTIREVIKLTSGQYGHDTLVRFVGVK